MAICRLSPIPYKAGKTNLDLQIQTDKQAKRDSVILCRFWIFADETPNCCCHSTLKLLSFSSYSFGFQGTHRACDPTRLNPQICTRYFPLRMGNWVWCQTISSDQSRKLPDSHASVKSILTM
jgi:hypothetical protein